MTYKIAEYKIRRKTRSLVTRAIREFVRAVRRKEPGVERYEAYQLPDGVSFIHFMAFRSADAERTHRAAHQEIRIGALPKLYQETTLHSIEGRSSVALLTRSIPPVRLAAAARIENPDHREEGWNSGGCGEWHRRRR